jgi:hypothetical protein
MEEKGVRPPATALGPGHMPLRELDRAADQIGTARESDTARLGVSFEEFAVAEAGERNDVRNSRKSVTPIFRINCGVLSRAR